MKWSIFVCFLVCLARFCNAGALRCPPGVTDPSCTEEKRELLDARPPSESGTEAQCLAGTDWESNCHYCRCSDSGVAECLKQQNCDKEVFAEPVLCKPNTTFQRDCNTCICLENGLGLCTLEFCRESGNPESAELLLEDTENEKEPTTKSEKIDIVPPITRRIEENFLETNVIKILKRSTICKPNDEFMKDCNPCKCAADGLSYSCTHNECLETDMNKEVEVFMQSEGVDHIERHSVCRARNTFYIGCNSCRCNPSGTDYACTNKPCPLPADVELFHEFKKLQANSSKNSTKQVCVANRMFIKECNTCWCNEDGTSYFCTRKVCVPLLPDEEADLGGIPAENLRVIMKECRPDEVFELDCNMCRCNPDGKSYACTRRACEEQTDVDKKVTLSRKVRSQGAANRCQPGQEFRMDCNQCLCNGEGNDFSCTRIDCNANNNHASLMGLPFTGTRSRRDTQQVEVKCVPGSVFDRDCNVCRCTTDGQHATCTLNKCQHPNELTGNVKAPESDLGFRCNAGEQFKRECNDCTCSADGKSVFCTLRLCDEELNPDI